MLPGRSAAEPSGHHAEVTNPEHPGRATRHYWRIRGGWQRFLARFTRVGQHHSKSTKEPKSTPGPESTPGFKATAGSKATAGFNSLSNVANTLRATVAGAVAAAGPTARAAG